MQVCDEQRAHLRERNTGCDQSAQGTVTTIDDVGAAVDDDGVGRLAAAHVDVRPALGAEQDEASTFDR